MASLISCPLCIFSTKHETIFSRHCLEFHAVELEQLYLQQNSYATGLCECGCKFKMPWLGWRLGYSKFRRGHNAVVSSSFTDPNVIESMALKRAEGLKTGRNKVWNTGLTKESNQSLAVAGIKKSATLKKRYASGELTPWQFRENAAESFKKSSITKKTRFAAGETSSWNDGLTKNTDSRMATIGLKISVAMKGRSNRRIPYDELVSRISAHSNRLLFVDDINNYTSKYQRLKFQCVTCGDIAEKTIRMYELNPVCFVCHPKESTAQLDIADFVISLGVSVVLSDRIAIAPKELDVYVPEHNFAIEYNSLYYHSEACIPTKDYHDIKVSMALNVGVTLFHVFEDEWKHSRQIVESMIRHRLGKTFYRIGARSLTLQVVSSKDATKFFDATHIDGGVKSKMTFALCDSAGNIVSAMSVRIPSQKKHYTGTLEIARYSSALNTIVNGGTSRLMTAVIDYAKNAGYTKIMTYADTRYGTGKGYIAAGMSRMPDTDIRFWWTDTSQRYDRFKYRADKSRGCTEADVAAEAKVWKIWGCRNRVYQIDIAA